MVHEHKIYLPLDENEGGYTHLEVSTYYDVGGYSYFTYTNTPRGYFICVQPVKKGDHTIMYEMFNGYKNLLEETKRFSQKKLDTLAEKTMENAAPLIQAVCNEHNLHVMEGA